MSKIKVAIITIKAKTALKVGSSINDFFQDSPIQKDWNSFPMILGTSLAGVLRKEFTKDEANQIFGDEDSTKKDTLASKLIVSNALLVDENDRVNETLVFKNTKFLENFLVLPKREHNSINDKGVTKKGGKFDEEVVYKGTKFRFSLTMKNDDNDAFQKVLDTLSVNHLRIGGGSTKGFGAIEIDSIFIKEFEELSQEHANFENSLNTKFEEKYTPIKQESDKYTKYILDLKPDDFFMFGSGFGDDDADMTPVYEKVINYDKKDFFYEELLIPTSSIKGALSHRTTYYYNKLEGITINSEQKAYESVEAIFGAKKDDNDIGFKGKILISDVYISNSNIKVFDHVAIDRFTGGAITSDLFQEKTSTTDENIRLEILLEKGIEDENAIKAFENSLDDICTGMLSLGGVTTKGHGLFTGEWKQC